QQVTATLEQVAATLDAAKEHADQQAAVALGNAKAYTDNAINEQLIPRVDQVVSDRAEAVMTQVAEQVIGEQLDETLANAKDYTDQKADETLNAANDYTNQQVAATLDEAKTYADQQDTATLAAAKAYTDQQDAATLNAAKAYADQQDDVTLNQAKAYADQRAAQALSDAKAYTDQQVSEARKYAARGIAAALALMNAQPSEAGKTAVSVGVGTYDGEVAFGLSLAHALRNMVISAGAAITEGTTAARVGF